MKLKFLAAKEAVRISPNGTAEVSFTDDVNHGFVFPDFNLAKKGLILNPNVLMGPAKAVVTNVRDIAVNIAEGEIVGIRVEEFGPAKMEEIEKKEVEEETPVNPDEIQDPMDEGNPEGSEESTEAPATEDSESAENTVADEVAAAETDESPEETPKKKSRKSK